MRTVNIIPYFNEEMHLLLRVLTFLDHIDLLIICEADKTHSGDPKPFGLKETLYKLGLDNHPKIKDVYINLPSKNENADNWVRERLQRDTLALFCLEDDIVISTDCDEFINPQYLDALKLSVLQNPEAIVPLPMSIHFCRADLIVHNNYGEPLLTHASFAATGKTCKKLTPSKIREAMAWNNNTNFEFTIPSNIVGWHFSWMGDGETRLNKLNSFAHSEDTINNGIGYLQSEKAKEFISNFTPKVGSTDMLARKDHILVQYPVSGLPEQIIQHEKLRNYYLP